MSYTVLARRYRSTDFDQVVGQEPIARTLKNAIAAGRVAHAYLFTGTRGVGKTSMARIFAAALNAPDTIPDCPKAPGDFEYPPKDIQHRMTQAIMRGDDLNVIEIDGASNRSVDEARQLIANAGLAPTGNARFKLYIIDEVHMLTREAFNALLKTMEEPPAHVKFILCTTEANKVPVTIQSRCQRFDFRSIPTAAIAEHLTRVLRSEKVEADKQVVWQLARLGNGSMRDALSLLDRLIASSGAGGQAKASRLTPDLLEQMLGLPDQQIVAGLIDAMASGDVTGSLQAVAGLMSRGVSQDQLIDTLIEHLRQLMLIAACGPESELVELSDDTRAAATEQARKFDAPGLVYMIALCENLQRSSKNSSHPRALLEATIVRLALAEKMADVTALLSGSSVSERRPAAATAPAAKPSTPAEQPKKKELTPAASSPAIDPAAGPGAVWSALLTTISDKPAMAWVRHLSLQSVDDELARVATLPGRRDLAGFVTPQRRQQLAAMLQPILGRPVRVELDPAAITDDASDAASSPSPQPGAPSQRMPASISQSDRAKAMSLPAVKQVLELFDATLVSVRHQPGSSPSQADAESSDPEP